MLANCVLDATDDVPNAKGSEEHAPDRRQGYPLLLRSKPVAIAKTGVAYYLEKLVNWVNYLVTVVILK